MAHFLSVHGGLSAEVMNNAADAYTAEAARSSFTSDNANLLSAEEQARRKSLLDNRNIFWSASAFLARHRLERLRKYASVRQ